MKYFASLVVFCFSLFNLNAQVSCTDCPNGNFINGILTSQIYIENSGPDDIGQNPLTAVCVFIQHNWLSDVALSLESPDGLNYVLMADDDNDWGGCQGVGAGNANICFVIGDSNPLTAGQPYYELCNGNGICLEGDFTATCSPMAYTPDYSAFPTPNCNILDYSQPGNTISGLWTLRLYCVCPDLELGAGGIIDWSLNFQDASGLSNGGNNDCMAFAGTETTESFVEVCENETELFLFDAISTNGQEIPSGDGFQYGVIVTQNDNIISFLENPEVQTEAWELGNYILKGISYHEDAVSFIHSTVGFPYSNLEDMQGNEAGGFCYSLSDFDMSVEVTTPIEMIEIYSLCEGTSIEIYGTEISEIGDYAFVSDIGATCDAIVYVEVQPGLEVSSFERVYPIVCEGETVEISAENGMSFLWSGPNGFSSTSQNIVFNNTDINASGTYTCEVTSFDGCVGSQVTELSLRCEFRPIEIELGQIVTFDFDQIVGVEDECVDINENIAAVDFTTSTISIAAQSEGEEEICFQAYENGLLKNISYLVNVGVPNAVIEPDVNLDIYPNPATNFLQIDANGVNVERVLFYDTKGILIKNTMINDTKADVMIEGLSQGLYIVKVKTSEGFLVRKLIVE